MSSKKNKLERDSLFSKSREYGTEIPLTVSQMFEDTATRYPNKVALSYKDVGSEGWKEITFDQYYTLCQQVAKSFIKVTLSMKVTVLYDTYLGHSNKSLN